MLFDVFRVENRQGGLEDWVGQVEAGTAEEAGALALDSFECDKFHHLYVAPSPVEETA